MTLPAIVIEAAHVNAGSVQRNARSHPTGIILSRPLARPADIRAEVPTLNHNQKGDHFRVWHEKADAEQPA